LLEIESEDSDDRLDYSDDDDSSPRCDEEEDSRGSKKRRRQWHWLTYAVRRNLRALSPVLCASIVLLVIAVRQGKALVVRQRSEVRAEK
jgi:hypothetical protein